MNTKTKSAIIRHGESLLAAFPNCTEKDPVALCKKLRRIETSLGSPLIRACNVGGDESEQIELDNFCDKAKAKVCALLYGPNDKSENRIFINRDPRGYALKLDDAWTSNYNRIMTRDNGNKCCLPLYADLGGYGILAPDLNQ